MTAYIEKNTIATSMQAYLSVLSKDEKQLIHSLIDKYSSKTAQEVISIICEKELNRRNITAEMRRYLIGKKYRADMMINKPFHNKSESHYNNSYTTALKIGAKYKISTASVFKYDTFARTLDTLFNSKSVSVDEILCGIYGCSSENIIKISHMPNVAINYLKTLFGKKYLKMAGFYEISFLNPEQKVIDENLPKIKIMPKDDPDAEFASLKYTIPSWTKTMLKVTNEDCSMVSIRVKSDLKQELHELKRTADRILKMIGDITYE